MFLRTSGVPGALAPSRPLAAAAEDRAARGRRRHGMAMFGADTDSERGYRWLMVLCGDAPAIALTARASARR
jgi:hypothetical protein